MSDPLQVFFSHSIAPSALVPPPRSFVDLMLPPSAIADDFDAYTDWLAEHLASIDLPVPENQRDLAAQHSQRDPMDAAGSLGLTAGFGWDLEADVASAIRRGLSYEGFIAEMRAIHDDDDAPPTPAEHFLREDDWERMAKEEETLSSMEPHPENADIPYRPLLAQLIKRLPLRGERVRLLTTFFAQAQEAARS